MIKEIMDIYLKQLDFYNEIYSSLKKFDKDNFPISEYENELQNIDFKLDNIKKLNDRAEQLKQIYVTKYRLSDFTGEEISKVEESSKCSEFKTIVENLSSKIVDVKKLHDRIISKLTKEMDFTNKLLKESNNGKTVNDIYKKNVEISKLRYESKK